MIADGFPGGIDDVIRNLCSNMFLQMSAMASDKEVDPAYQDIFMEQGKREDVTKALCRS